MVPSRQPASPCGGASDSLAGHFSVAAGASQVEPSPGSDDAHHQPSRQVRDLACWPTKLGPMPLHGFGEARSQKGQSADKQTTAVTIGRVHAGVDAATMRERVGTLASRSPNATRTRTPSSPKPQRKPSPTSSTTPSPLRLPWPGARRSKTRGTRTGGLSLLPNPSVPDIPWP